MGRLGDILAGVTSMEYSATKASRPLPSPHQSPWKVSQRVTMA